MAAQAKLNPAGASVSWSLSLTNRMLGSIRGYFSDKNGVSQQLFGPMKSSATSPARFAMSAQPQDLIGGTLFWECNVFNPNDVGGPFVCVVAVDQGGYVTCQDAAPGNVDSGSGQTDLKGDQITFSS